MLSAKRKKWPELAWDVVDDARKIEQSAKEILAEAETVGKNSNTVVTQATELAAATEKIKSDLQELIDERTKILNSFLEKNAN